MAALSQERWQGDVESFMKSIEATYKQLVTTWVRNAQQGLAHRSDLAVSQAIKRDTQQSLQSLFPNSVLFLDTARKMLPEWKEQKGTHEEMKLACLEWANEQIGLIKGWLMHSVGRYGENEDVQKGFDELANLLKTHVEQQVDQFWFEHNASETVDEEVVAQSMPFFREQENHRPDDNNIPQQGVNAEPTKQKPRAVSSPTPMQTAG